MVNQGNGRKTRGGRANAANAKATAAWVESYLRQKAENRRRYTATDIHTGETQIVTKTEMNELLNGQIDKTGFNWSFAVRDRLFQGDAIQIGDVVFQIQMAEVAMQ